MNKKKSANLFDKRQQFAVSIRRQKIQAYKKQIRHLYQQSKKQLTISQLIKQFQLQSSKSFNDLQQNQSPCFQLLHILFCVQDSLLYLQPQQSQRSNNQCPIQIEVYPKPTIKFIKPEQQTLLYYALNQDMYTNQKYKDLPKDYQLEVIGFLEKFIKRNNYHKVSLNKNFQIAFFNFIQLFLSYIQVPDLRYKLLQWIKGTEALALIQICVDGTFLNLIQFQHIYDILLLCLASQNMSRKSQAISIMFKNLRCADYDDIQSLLKGKSKLLSELIQFIDRYSQMSYQQLYAKQVIQKSIYCLCLYLQTYDQLILSITQQGVGYIGIKLLCSSKQYQNLGGLMILSRLTNIQSSSTIQFISTDHSICFIQQWNNVSRILRSQNRKIREQLVRFFRNLVQYGHVENVDAIANRFYSQGYGMVQFLLDIAMQQQNLDIFQCAVLTLYTLARQINQMMENVQIQENLVLNKIVQKKLKIKLQHQLIKRQNRTFQYIQGFIMLIKNHQQKINYSNRQIIFD